MLLAYRGMAGLPACKHCLPDFLSSLCAGDLHKVPTGQSASVDHGPITQIAAALKYFSG